MKKIVFLIAALLLTVDGSAAADKKEIRITGVTARSDRGLVEVTFEAQVGRRATPNNQARVITPVLTGGDHRLELLPIVVEGRRARVSRTQRLDAERQWPNREPYYTANGETVAYRYEFAYADWMAGADLLVEDAGVTFRGTTRPEERLVAAGLLPRATRQEPPAMTAVPPLAEIVPEPVAAPESTGERLARRLSFVVPAGRAETLPVDMPTGPSTEGRRADYSRLSKGVREGALMVAFAQGRSAVDRGLDDNQQVLNELVTAIRTIEESADSRIARIVVVGFASPEGLLDDNDRLAWNRAVALRDYIREWAWMPAEVIRTYNGSVDWEGLSALVAASAMPSRDEVLRIIATEPIWDAYRNVGRHGELMRLGGGDPYRYMMTRFFPQLRQAALIKIYYENK